MVMVIIVIIIMIIVMMMVMMAGVVISVKLDGRGTMIGLHWTGLNTWGEASEGL